MQWTIKDAARWAVYLPLFIIPFIPLYVANDLFFPFITGKGFAFRILVEMALAGYVLLALAEPKYRPRFSWTFALYGAFVLWMLIADLFGVNPAKAIWSNFERMEGWVTLIHVFAFFLVSGAVLSTDKLWRSWWLTFIGASALLCGYCLLQLGGYITIHQGGVRVDGTMGNAAYLAAYLLFAAAVTIWQALESKGWLKWTLFVLAALQVIIVFFTATRGAIIGFVAAALVATLVWLFESKGRARQVSVGILVVIVLAAGGFFLAKDTPVVQHNEILSRIASIGPSDLSVRFTLWHMALEGFAQSPKTVLLGWGQEGFNYVFDKYYDPSMYAQEPWFDRAHNVFFDWLIAGGLPGLLLFLSAFAMALYALYTKGASREERVLLVAALVAYAVQGLVVFDNLFTYVPLAAILAMAHGVSGRPYKRLEVLPPLSEINQQIALPVAVVFAVVLIWFVNVPNIAAAYDLVHAISISGTDLTQNAQYFQKALAEPTFGRQEIREQLIIFSGNVASSPEANPQVVGQFVGYALDQMGQEIKSLPNDPRLRLEYELGYRIAGDYKDALAQLQIAHQLSPKKQSILVEMGVDEWQSGDFKSAQQYFDQAYDLDHSFPDLLAYAAAGDIAAGDLAGGKARLMQSLGTTTVDSEPLILAYYQAKDFPDLILALQLQVRNQNGSAASMFRLAAGYAAAGDKATARSLINAAIAQHPDAASQGQQLLQHI